MKSIFDLAPMPSDAIYAMVKGLTDALEGKYEKFQVYMGSYGDIRAYGPNNSNICIGCAATCTLMALAGKEIPATFIRDRHLFLDILDDYNENVLSRFESAIDDLRSTEWQLFLSMYAGERGYPNLQSSYAFKDQREWYKQYTPTVNLVVLSNLYTKEDLVPYTKYADQLKAMGI